MERKEDGLWTSWTWQEEEEGSVEDEDGAKMAVKEGMKKITDGRTTDVKVKDDRKW